MWELETSELFDDRERAALRMARDAALVPNQTTTELEARPREFATQTLGARGWEPAKHR